jgi:hypothetical protein
MLTDLNVQIRIDGVNTIKRYSVRAAGVGHRRNRRSQRNVSDYKSLTALSRGTGVPPVFAAWSVSNIDIEVVS